MVMLGTHDIGPRSSELGFAEFAQKDWECNCTTSKRRITIFHEELTARHRAKALRV
jgi:hypothetical protein